MDDVFECTVKPLLTQRSLMPFGKYRGLPIGEIIVRDPRYVAWAVEHVGDFRLDAETTDALQRRLKW